MQECDFSRPMTRDSTVQQHSETVRGVYEWFVAVALLLGCHIGVKEKVEYATATGGQDGKATEELSSCGCPTVIRDTVYCSCEIKY